MPLLRADGREFDCQAVLFDKDGTLIDFKAMWLAWSKYMLDEVCAAAELETKGRGALECAMGIDLAAWHVDPWGPLAGGNMSGLRESMAAMLKTTGMNEEDAGRLVMDVAEQSDGAMDWEALAAPIPGINDMLGRLRDRGFKLAVVTADSSVRANISFTGLQLSNYFDVVVGADCVQNSKPAPDMALLACRELGIEPGLAVVLGDTPRDIIMAREAGSAGIGVLSGVCTREQLIGASADAVINSVAELE